MNIREYATWKIKVSSACAAELNSLRNHLDKHLADGQPLSPEDMDNDVKNIAQAINKLLGSVPGTESVGRLAYVVQPDGVPQPALQSVPNNPQTKKVAK